ncbi:MAG: hypothetical protein ACI4PV_07145 [Butyricicoccus sp.]
MKKQSFFQQLCAANYSFALQNDAGAHAEASRSRAAQKAQH